MPHHVLHDFAKADRGVARAADRRDRRQCAASRRGQGRHLRQPDPRDARRRGEEAEGQAGEGGWKRRQGPGGAEAGRTAVDPRGESGERRPVRPRPQEAVRRLRHRPSRCFSQLRSGLYGQADRTMGWPTPSPSTLHSAPAQRVQGPVAAESARMTRSCGRGGGRQVQPEPSKTASSPGSMPAPEPSILASVTIKPAGATDQVSPPFGLLDAVRPGEREGRNREDHQLAAARQCRGSPRNPRSRLARPPVDAGRGRVPTGRSRSRP